MSHSLIWNDILLSFASTVFKSKAFLFASMVWVFSSTPSSQNGKILSIKTVASSESISGRTWPSSRAFGKSWFSVWSRMPSTGLTCCQEFVCLIKAPSSARICLESRSGPSLIVSPNLWSRHWRRTWRRSTFRWWSTMIKRPHSARSIMNKTQLIGSQTSPTTRSEGGNRSRPHELAVLCWIRTTLAILLSSFEIDNHSTVKESSSPFVS